MYSQPSNLVLVTRGWNVNGHTSKYGTEASDYDQVDKRQSIAKRERNIPETVNGA